jgi:RNA polymerase sigma factor (sigma-70 family)
MHDARDAEDRRLLEAGDHRRLVEAYYGLIVGRCRARIHDEGEAIDVAAAVAVRLLSELKAGKRYPVPYRVVVNKVVTWTIGAYFERGKIHHVELDDVHPADDAYETVEAELDVAALIADLPERERQVAWLRIVAGLSPEQIAEKLGITRNNVDQAWHRAKRRLGLLAEAA